MNPVAETEWITNQHQRILRDPAVSRPVIYFPLPGPAQSYRMLPCLCLGDQSGVCKFVSAPGFVLLTSGYNIIRAIGVRLSAVTPSRGFCIELSTALVVVLASKYGLPISTTHCQVCACRHVYLHVYMRVCLRV